MTNKDKKISDLELQIEFYKNELAKVNNKKTVINDLKKICLELNIDKEDVLLEYDEKENGFDILYDEGIEEVFYVRKGFISLF